MSNEETANNKTSTIALAVGAVSFLALGFVFWDTLVETALICWNDDDYSHGLLLPLISLYLLWENKEEISKAKSPSLWQVNIFGIVLLILGQVGFGVGLVSDLLFIRWVSFFISLVGVLLLVFGSSLTWLLAPALLLNFMAKPLPDSLVPALFWPLQNFAAKVSAWVLEITNVPVYLKGNVIEIPGMSLMVEEACSGLRSLMALLTVALIVLFSMPLKFAYKVLIVFLAIAIAVALNIVRVAATGLLAHFYDPKAATGFFHSFSGLIVFVVGLAALYYVGSLLEKREKRSRTV